MFGRHFKQIKNFHFSVNKTFAKHSDVIIIGGGTGGIAMAKQLPNIGIKKEQITIFDPSEIHHYQPSWTIIGGLAKQKGFLSKSSFQIKKLLGKDYNFQNTGIKELNPENNSLIDEKGEKWTYHQLIVSCGIKVKYDSIPGILYFYIFF